MQLTVSGYFVFNQIIIAGLLQLF